MKISREPKFICHRCGSGRTRVVNSRPVTIMGSTQEGTWRRRECVDCGEPLETVERRIQSRTDLRRLA